MTARLLRLAHVLVAAVWLGAVVVIAALVAADDARLDHAAFVVADVVVWSSLLSLSSALALALFSPWGFFRFRFVWPKWLALFALGLLAVCGRTPALNTLAAHAADRGRASVDRGAALGLVVVEVVVLVIVFALSALRPFGRAARDHEPKRLARAAIVVVFVVVAVAAVAQSAWLRHLRRLPVAAVDIAAVADGVYAGEDGVARVVVTVGGGRVVAVAVDAPDVADGSVYADLAADVIPRMIAAQRVDVDAVAGATTTARALQRATAAALAAAPQRTNPRSP